ncbi:hypothetical protein F4810DRAFT_706562 [Camillea tinctor]|nr:hypothetical protein F4810DRAFT_706562 [Camillea tinctor]
MSLPQEYSIVCPLCAVHYTVWDNFLSYDTRITENPEWVKRKVVTWKPFSSPQLVATVHTVGEAQTSEERPWACLYFLRGYDWSLFSIQNIGWNVLRRELVFFCDGACWDVALARFGGTEEKLATGLARLLFSLNWGRMEYSEPLSTRWVDRLTHSLCMPVKPQALRTHLDIYRVLDVDPGEVRAYLDGLTEQGRVSRLVDGKHADTTDMDGLPSPFRTWVLPPPRNDIISRLPTDLQLTLLEFVDTKDLPQLRLASRHIASISALDNLPQSIWKARFYAERGWMVPTSLDGSEDWRSLFFSSSLIPLATRQHITTSYLDSLALVGWKERRQIWQNLDGVAQLLNKAIQGLPVEKDRLKSLHTGDIAWNDLLAARTPLLVLMFLSLSYGLHEFRCLPSISQDYRLRGIGVTMVMLGTRYVIAGLRIWHLQEGTDVLISDGIGYVSADSEIIIEVHGSEELSGIRVAYANNVAIAINFTLINHRIGIPRETYWVGDLHEQSPHHYVSSWSRSSRGPFSITGRFDYCGLVGLYVWDEASGKNSQPYGTGPRPVRHSELDTDYHISIDT